MNIDLNKGVGKLLGLMINVLSSAFASMLNAVFMRQKEWFDGVEV